jgi:polyferredoxin
MPEESPASKKNSRSLTIRLGATEWLFILGLLLLASGISLSYSIPTAMIFCGAVCILAAFYNAIEDKIGTRTP